MTDNATRWWVQRIDKAYFVGRYEADGKTYEAEFKISDVRPEDRALLALGAYFDVDDDGYLSFSREVWSADDIQQIRERAEHYAPFFTDVTQEKKS